MDSIEKVHRRGVDVETAFTAGVRQAGANARAPGAGSGGVGSRSSSSKVGPGMSPTTRGISGRAKALIRPPFVRLRRFLLAPLQKDLSEQLGDIRAEIGAIKRSGPPVAIPTPDGNVLLRTSVGFVLSSTADLRALARLIESGEFEPGNRLLIERLSGPGTVFVDVEADLGLHAIAAARAMRGEGRVYAFTATEVSAALLRESVRINGLDEMVDVRVIAASLDDALADAPPVGLLRIGARGSAQEVLNAARFVIERNPEIAVIAEVRPAQLAREGQSLTAWFGEFERFGFEFRAIDQDSGRLWIRTMASLNGVEAVNLLFARPDARAWLRGGPA